MGAPPHDIADLRARLEAGAGPTLWRSLDAVADTPAFRSFLSTEFPAAARLADGPDRRQFIRLMAASFAMAGLGACSRDADGRSHEVPYVRNPERIEAGASLSYASASLLDGIANGVLVTTRNGRPLKIEGNPDHPWSRGGTDVFAQAGILDLYDPSRSQAVRYLNRISTWDAFRTAMAGAFGALRADGGRGLRLLTGPVTSPTMLAAIDRLHEACPAMVWHVVSAVSREPRYQASLLAFGQRLETRWDFGKARVVVSLGGDLLDAGPHQVGVARQWAEARKAAAAQGRLLELHAAASTPNLTSAKADHHLAIEPGDMLGLVRALAPGGGTVTGTDPRAVWVRRAAAALRGARGAGIVLAGGDQPVEVQAAVHRLNAALGNVGTAVTFAPALLPEAPGLEPLVAAMQAGEVSTLLTVGANPVYAAPAALHLVDALAKVKLKVHAGQFVDETAAHADWHVPLAHPLESWGDARALDGTVTLHQPTIAPLYSGRSDLELISLLTEEQGRDGLAMLRENWQNGRDATAFEPWWRQAVVEGYLPGTAVATVPVALVPEAAPLPPQTAPAGLTVLFRPDPCLWDGAFSNNAWLQELPKPLTKIVWDAPVAISPALAEQLGLAQGDLVSVALDGRSLTGPVWILPGQAPRTVTLVMGFGRAVPDMVSTGIGYDASAVRSSELAASATGATLTRLEGQRIRFATTQDHSTMEGHDFVRTAPVGVTASPLRSRAAPRSLYPPKPGEERAWGMVIDVDACIGCNACVVACQSENNIPVVGRAEVAVGREMHWLRIDRYYSGLKGGGGLDDPDTHFQPVPCMHCEDAPCEVGCPVEATLHDHEGLNLMVYNRCVGTRACSGYCPYKVRHFNYADYSGAAPEVQLQRNPEVTVRAKGVMEKCTYCVQRIADARITSDKTGEAIADGAVQTACQGACPTRAITFGDLNDAGSAVAAARHDARNYPLLGELNLKPRTTYLAERRAPVAEGG